MLLFTVIGRSFIAYLALACIHCASVDNAFFMVYGEIGSIMDPAVAQTHL